MAHEEMQRERAEKAFPFMLMPTEFMSAAKDRIEEIAHVQNELVGKFNAVNRHWLERMQAEASLASEFASKFSAARSPSDAMTTCQEWTSRQFEMIAEDSKHFLDDTQDFIQTGAGLLTNGWRSKGGMSS